MEITLFKKNNLIDRIRKIESRAYKYSGNMITKEDYQELKKITKDNKDLGVEYPGSVPIYTTTNPISDNFCYLCLPRFDSIMVDSKVRRHLDYSRNYFSPKEFSEFWMYPKVNLSKEAFLRKLEQTRESVKTTNQFNEDKLKNLSRIIQIANGFPDLKNKHGHVCKECEDKGIFKKDQEKYKGEKENELSKLGLVKGDYELMIKVDTEQIWTGEYGTKMAYHFGSHTAKGKEFLEDD